MMTVIVTGGSRGLGLGIARNLAMAGYSVIAIARREDEQLISVINEVMLSGRGALHFWPFDLGEISRIPDLVKALRREFGAPYGLVNNAALGSHGILATMHNAQIERTIQLNTLSPLLLTKYVARSMMVGAGGRIVNVASIVSFTGYSGLSVYAATYLSNHDQRISDSNIVN
jgi:3-oxoacyl-[acyl-carrier protein] reductase